MGNPIGKEQASILAQQMASLAQGNQEKEDLVKKFLNESMVRLPVGRLWMGSMPGEGVPEVIPRHSVFISRPFCSLPLIPQGLYREIMGKILQKKKERESQSVI